MYVLYAFLLFMFQRVRCELFSPISTLEQSANYDEGSWIHAESYNFANENELQHLSVTDKPGRFILNSGIKKSSLFTRGTKRYLRTKEKRTIVYSIRKRDENTKNMENSSINERSSSQSQDVTSNLVNITSAVETLSKNNDKNVEQSRNFFRRIHMTITRSRDAIWAFTALTLLCVLLAIAVLCSRMWQDYHGIPLYQPSLPDLHEKIPFKEALGAKLKFLRWLKRRQKWRTKKETGASSIEMEELLSGTHDSDEEIQ